MLGNGWRVTTTCTHCGKEHHPNRNGLTPSFCSCGSNLLEQMVARLRDPIERAAVRRSLYLPPETTPT